MLKTFGDYELVQHSVVPWHAAGPGWSNEGAFFRVRRRQTDSPPVEYQECLYNDKLPVPAILMRIATELQEFIEAQAWAVFCERHGG